MGVLGVAAGAAGAAGEMSAAGIGGSASGAFDGRVGSECGSDSSETMPIAA
jgi:hypothetical protein